MLIPESSNIWCIFLSWYPDPQPRLTQFISVMEFFVNVLQNFLIKASSVALLVVLLTALLAVVEAVELLVVVDLLPSGN